MSAQTSGCEVRGHTPGPWHLKVGADGNKYGAIMGPDNVLVATTGYRVCVESSEDENNARLIAAAPDLLKAAKRALRVLKAQGEAVLPGNALGALDAAIEKAEGRDNG